MRGDRVDAGDGLGFARDLIDEVKADVAPWNAESLFHPRRHDFANAASRPGFISAPHPQGSR
jgi:hypothetical protein